MNRWQLVVNPLSGEGSGVLAAADTAPIECILLTFLQRIERETLMRGNLKVAGSISRVGLPPLLSSG